MFGWYGAARFRQPEACDWSRVVDGRNYVSVARLLTANDNRISADYVDAGISELEAYANGSDALVSA